MDMSSYLAPELLILVLYEKPRKDCNPGMAVRRRLATVQRNGFRMGVTASILFILLAHPPARVLCAMSSSRDFILGFIKKYKENPCLWQVKNCDYHYKHKRQAALMELLTFLKSKDGNANLDTVKKKIASLRNCFNKEYNKVKLSIAAGTEDIHVPKLWYYNAMLFLADSDTPMQKRSVVKKHSLLEFKAFGEDTEVSEDSDADVPRSKNVPSSSAQTQASGSTKYKHNSRKRPRSEADPLLPSSSTRAGSPPQPPPPKLAYRAFGEHIAEKLRGMPALMATYCQKLINDAIYLGELNTLNMTSHIVTKNSVLPQTPVLHSEEREACNPSRTFTDSKSDLENDLYN